jgi:hypothetical protein
MTTPDPDATARIESATPFTPRARAGDAQFAPGTIVAGRYRIASILGSGGMGEVYRADDTKLGQTVALKFLPARLARDPILLARLHDEVRLGRVIAHPNVCRLYDIVDWDGGHFVAMEYVDGEDLSRLLRRIGRLAHDKAVDIARGIAAGLMAAHAKGTLHRDIKPANVMIDSRGEARIMDFGLALAAGEDDGTISGTPAYMAPEQLSGEPATVQSDLYALGLVMYELFTGKRAHNARSLHERVRDITSEITTPSNLIRDLDPAVERIILRCLANDPAQRPRSAREVIEALPGGDPLAAALAAGQTPSPRAVAAAGTEGSLKPWVAWTLLAAVLVCLFVTLEGKRLFGITQFVALDRTPDVLRERAAATLRTLGVPAQSYSTHAFTSSESYLGWIYANDRTPRRWERLRNGPAAVSFTFIESARPLPPELPTEIVKRPGTTIANVDPRGRLVSLEAVPLREWPARAPDWNALLAAAGLDPAKLAPAKPRLVPSSAADAHVAWSGRHPDDGTPIHVEAAAWRGTPVFLQISGPWENTSMDDMPFSGVRMTIFATVLFVTVAVIGLLLAWRNARLRRGDRGGALKVALTMLALNLLTELLMADHQPAGLHEVDVLRRALESSLLWAAIVFLLYLALEPFVRRRWPALLIGSGRLLAGNARNPMVGRDVLIGMLAGLAHPALILTNTWAESRMGNPVPLFFSADALNGSRQALSHLANALASGAMDGFIFVIILVTFMLVLRNRVAAAVGLWLVAMTGYFAVTGRVAVLTTVIAAMLVYVTARFGLLAIATAQAAFHAIFHNQLFTTESWGSLQVLPVAFVLLTAAWAFYTSLGGQSPFSASLLDD